MSNDEATLGITVDQWREALGAAQQGDPGQTVAEIAQQLGLPKSTAMGRLDRLVKEGKCRKGRATRTDSAGRKYYVNVYQLLENK